MAKRTDPKPAAVPFRGYPRRTTPPSPEGVGEPARMDGSHAGRCCRRWVRQESESGTRCTTRFITGRTSTFASQMVLGNQGAAGVDQQTVEKFQEHQLEELNGLMEDLRTGKYQPQAVKRCLGYRKPGSLEGRPLGIPTVRDRVVQTALLDVLEPIFATHHVRRARGYGFRQGPGLPSCFGANREVTERGLHARRRCCRS